MILFFKKVLTFLFLLFIFSSMALILLGWRAGSIYDYVDTFDGAKLPDVDAIVVLAGARGRISAAGDLWYRYYELSDLKREIDRKNESLKNHAELNSVAVGRIELPTNPIKSILQKDSKTPLLYVSGMGRLSTFNVFQSLVRPGVSKVFKEDDVFLEVESTNTEENAKIFVKKCRQKGWKKIILMTSAYHMKRAQLIFNRIFDKEGLKINYLSHTIIQEPFSKEEWQASFHGIQVTMLEYFKWIYYSAFWDP